MVLPASLMFQNQNWFSPSSTRNDLSCSYSNSSFTFSSIFSFIFLLYFSSSQSLFIRFCSMDCFFRSYQSLRLEQAVGQRWQPGCFRGDKIGWEEEKWKLCWNVLFIEGYSSEMPIFLKEISPVFLELRGDVQLDSFILLRWEASKELISSIFSYISSFSFCLAGFLRQLYFPFGLLFLDCTLVLSPNILNTLFIPKPVPPSMELSFPKRGKKVEVF